MSLKTYSGYPAYAGIVLVYSDKYKGLIGLPRIRGDSPLPNYVGELFIVVTPHTRG